MDLEGQELRRFAIYCIGISSLGKGEIQFGQNLDVAPNVDRFVSHKFGQFGQDAPDFLVFAQLQLSNRIVLLHDLDRFDE